MSPTGIAAVTEPYSETELIGIEQISAATESDPGFTPVHVRRLLATIDALKAELREISKGLAIPVRIEITPKDLDQLIRKRGTEFVAVVEAAKAMLEKTANADGVHYVVECEAWDALHEALRPFLPPPDPEMVF